MIDALENRLAGGPSDRDVASAHDQADPGPERSPVRDRAGGHDPPVVAWAVPVVVVGAAVAVNEVDVVDVELVAVVAGVAVGASAAADVSVVVVAVAIAAVVTSAVVPS